VDHRFQVDDAMLAQALVANVTRAGPSRVAVRLAPGKVGHAMPTGDLFRRLEVRAAADRDGEVVARATRYLSRKFTTELVGETSARVDRFDDRVGARLAPCFELELGRRAVGLPIALEVAYQRVQEPRTAEERGAIVNGEATLVRVRVSDAGPFSPCAEDHAGATKAP
jgi:hypothetical protein